MAKTISCIIVDDEPMAREILENHLKRIDSIHIVGSCKNAVEAFNLLNSENIDLIFLDINMPEINGLEMLKTLNIQPKVILTTAYSEFALESYDLGVVDYLLKPIKLDRFIKSVNRALDQFNHKENSEIKTNLPEDQSKSLFIKEDHIT